MDARANTLLGSQRIGAVSMNDRRDYMSEDHKAKERERRLELAKTRRIYGGMTKWKIRKMERYEEKN
jgi:hypothetical protein